VSGIPAVYHHEYTRSIRYTARERVPLENLGFNYMGVVIKILRNYLSVLFNSNNLILNKLITGN